MTRFMKATVLIMAVLLTVGCIGLTLRIRIEPNPITFTAEEMSQEVTVRFTTSGVGRLRLERASVLLVDDEGEEQVLFTEEIGYQGPAGFGVSQDFTEEAELPSQYADNYEQFRGREFTLIVAVEGSHPVRETVTVQLQ